MNNWPRVVSVSVKGLVYLGGAFVLHSNRLGWWAGLLVPPSSAPTRRKYLPDAYKVIWVS